MFDEIYSYSCLDGFQAFHEHTTYPQKGSLSGWSIKKIEYFDLESSRYMDGAIGIVVSRVLAFALPVIALLDVLASPCKALYFTATKHPGKALEEIAKGVNFLILSLFSLISLPFSLYAPTQVYHSDSAWDEIKQKHFRDKLQEALQQCREDSGTDTSDAQLLSQAITQTLPKVFKTDNPEDTIEPIVRAISSQLEKLPDESVILMEHFTQWVSLFVVACHREKLPLDAIDDIFYDLITETIRLKNPQLRGEMTSRIVRDFAKGKTVVTKFKSQLTAFESKREEEIAGYIEERKANKLREKTRLEDQIKRREEQLADVPNTDKNERKRAGMQGGIDKLKEKLTTAGVIDDAFLQEVNAKSEDLFLPFTSNNHAYLPLYFSLVNVQYSDTLFDLLRTPIFKDCHQNHFLLNFLLLQNEHANSINPAIMIKGLEEAHKQDVDNEDKQYSRTIQFLKNATVLMQLKEWDRIETHLNDKSTPLHAESIIPQIFKERFDLTTVERYQGDDGNSLFVQDYDASFARFRDPTTIMILYSTLTLLKPKESEAAIEGLTRYVRYTLDSAHELQAKRHDPELSAHLKECYEKASTIRPLWENQSFTKLTENDPKYSGYTIGEASTPCDLLMSSQEVLKSCLHPAGRPHKVKGFLGVLLDGKIHPVVIKDPSGKIVARMLLKLLINEEDNSSCLMKDTVYTNSHQQSEVDFFEGRIMEYSLQRANELGLPLVSSEKADSESKQSIGPIVSRISPSPFEHVNAFEGPQLANKVVFENGNYSIPKVYVVS